MSEDVRDATTVPAIVPEPRLASPSSALPTNEQMHTHFSPYRRISPPWTFYDRVKTVVLAIFVLPIRLLYLALAGFVILAITSIAVIGMPPTDTPITEGGDPEDRDYGSEPLNKPLSKWRKAMLNTIFPIARSILFVSLGVYNIHTEERSFSDEVPQKAHTAGKAYVIVANHLGYIDILVLLCKFKGSFVAKGELEATPIVGRLARALQCMFVRKGHSLTSQLIARVQSTYKCHRKRATCAGCPSCMSKLIIFPEGTTTNGTAMVPFRTGVFNAGLPVKPVCIEFPYQHFNLSWETIRFREHLFRTMTQFRNNVRITELPVYDPSEDEMLDARLFACNVQAEMAKVLAQPIIPLNRKHKFLYHSWLLGKEESPAEVLKKSTQLFSEDEQLTYFAENRIMDNV